VLVGPLGHKIIDVLLGLLEVENRKGVNGMRINELVEHRNVQHHRKFALVALEILIVVYQLLKGEKQLCRHFLKVEYVLLLGGILSHQRRYQ
jgi:hypothetical protein